MKKSILLLIMALSSITLYAQNPKNDTTGTFPTHLERYYGRLYNGDNGMKMDRTSLQNTLSSEDFTLYRKARRELIAAIPLWTLSGVFLTLATNWYCAMIDLTYFHVPYSDAGGSLVYFILGCSALGMSLITFIPAIILTLDSYKKLDHVASSYNQKSYPVSLSFGPTRHGVGITLNF